MSYFVEVGLVSLDDREIFLKSAEDEFGDIAVIRGTNHPWYVCSSIYIAALCKKNGTKKPSKKMCESISSYIKGWKAGHDPHSR